VIDAIKNIAEVEKGRGMSSLSVYVSLYGFVRDLVKERDVRLSLSGDNVTVQDLVEHLAERYGEPFRERLIDSQGKLRDNVKVFINGERVGDLAERMERDGRAPQEVRVIVLWVMAGG